MNRLLSLLALGLVLTGPAGAAEAAAKHPDSKGWPALFAPDLSDALCNKEVWSVRDGVLTATRDECIWTQKEYENFDLDLEFKCGDGANGGVLVYCTDTGAWIPNSVEVQILDDLSPKCKNAAPTSKCAAIFGRLAPSKSAVKKTGEWNRMTLTCRGPLISVVLNGELVTECDMRRFTSAKKNPDGSDVPPWLSRPMAEMATRGRIGLQGMHGGVPISFRNLRIRLAE